MPHYGISKLRDYRIYNYLATESKHPDDCGWQLVRSVDGELLWQRYNRNKWDRRNSQSYDYRKVTASSIKQYAKQARRDLCEAALNKKIRRWLRLAEKLVGGWPKGVI